MVDNIWGFDVVPNGSKSELDGDVVAVKSAVTSSSSLFDILVRDSFPSLFAGIGRYCFLDILGGDGF